MDLPWRRFHLPPLALLCLLLHVPFLHAQTSPPADPAPATPQAEILSPEEALKRLRPSEEALLAQAINLQTEGNPADAVPLYSDILRYYPDGTHNEETLFRIAECYQALGRFEEAVSTLLLARKKHPKGKLLHAGFLLQGELLSAEKKWKNAVPILKKAAQSEQTRIQLRSAYLLILAFENLGKLTEASPEIKTLLATSENNPYLPYAKLKQAILQTTAGQTTEAKKLLQEIISSSAAPAIRAEAAVRAGNLEYQNKNYADAIAYYEIVRRTESPDFWRKLAHLGLIQASFASGDYQRVTSVYHDVKPAFPSKTRPQVIFLTAESHRLSKQYKPALELYAFLLKEFPDDPIAEASAWARLLILRQANDPTFLGETARFLAKFPKSKRLFQVQLMRADACFESGAFKTCAPMFKAITDQKEKLEKLAPEIQANIWYHQALAYFLTQNYPESLAPFKTLISAFPSSPSLPNALWLLGQAQQETGKPKEALDTWQTLLTTHPKFPEKETALWKTSLLAGSLKEPSLMEKWLQRLLQDFPLTKHRADAHYWLAVSQKQLQNESAALPHWQAAREAAPDRYFQSCTRELIQSALQDQDLPKLMREVAAYEKWHLARKHAVDLNPEIYEWIGQQLALQDQLKEAETYYRKTLALTPDPARAHRPRLALCQLLSKQKNHGAAIREWSLYRKTYADERDRSAVLDPLAQAYIGAADYKQATELAEQILRQNPEGTYNAKGRLLLGEIQFGKHHYEEAAKIFSAVSLLIEDPDITPLALQRAKEAYRRAGQHDKAAKMAEQLLKRWLDNRENPSKNNPPKTPPS